MCSLRAHRALLIFLVLNPDTVYDRRYDRFGKRSRDTVYRGILFVKKRTRIFREFERIPEDQILVIVKYLVLAEIADRHCRDDRYFVNACPTLAVEQHAREIEISNRAFDHRVGAFGGTLHAETVTTTDDLARHGLCKSRCDAVSKTARLGLKRGHRHTLYVLRQTRIRHRLIAFGKAADRKHHGK